ncbi:MAG TPA: macro domain-containing protein [Anaerolineales bacterium]|nr:macro domain-containing protein [Anaerolineales bacterium]
MSFLLSETILSTGQTLQLVEGDITSEATDAIVNAANASLLHGAGVAGAILRRGGSDIQRESDEWVEAHGPVSHAAPAWTSGGSLPCRYVIHAVGPVWGDGNEDAKLAAAVSGSLDVADGLKLASIALPAISTGIYGFPRERAGRVILAAVVDYFAKRASGLRLVRVVLFDRPTVSAFESAWHDQFSA